MENGENLHQSGNMNGHQFGVALGGAYEPWDLMKLIMKLEMYGHRASLLHGALWTIMGNAVYNEDILKYGLELCGDMYGDYAKWWNCAHAIGHGVYVQGVAREEAGVEKHPRLGTVEHEIMRCHLEKGCGEDDARIALLLKPLVAGEKICLTFPYGAQHSCSDGLFMSFMDQVMAVRDVHLPISFCAHHALTSMCVSKVGTRALEKHDFGRDVNGTGACQDQETAWASTLCDPNDFPTFDKLLSCSFGMGDALSRAHRCFGQISDVTACSGFDKLPVSWEQAQALAAACIAGTRHLYYFTVFESTKKDWSQEECDRLCSQMATHPDPTIRSIKDTCLEYTPCKPKNAITSWEDAYPSIHVPL